MSRVDSGENVICLTSPTLSLVDLDNGAGNRGLQLPVKIGDRAIQRATLFLRRVHLRSTVAYVQVGIYLESDVSDSLCEPVHDAKKLDNRRKIHIEGVLELGSRAPAGCVGCELSNIESA